MSAHASRPLTGRHVFLMLLAFFGIIFAANAALIWMAGKSFNGLAEDQAYEKGLAYNEVLEQGRMQERDGWTVKANFAEGRFVIELADRHGPVSGAEGTATLFRVIRSGEDLSAPLASAGAAGQYSVALTPPEPGLWELRVEVRYNGRTYDSRQRLDIKRADLQ